MVSNDLSLHYMKHPLNPYKPVSESRLYQKNKEDIDNHASFCFCCPFSVFKVALPIIIVLQILLILLSIVADMAIAGDEVEKEEKFNEEHKDDNDDEKYDE